MRHLWAKLTEPFLRHNKEQTHVLGAFSLAVLLGGSQLVISGVICPLIWVITIVTLFITPLLTSHDSPSMQVGEL